MSEDRPRDSWDEIIDQMPDTHGSHDHFTTTRDAVRWAISTAFSSGEYWVEDEPEPEPTTVREAARQWVDMVREAAARPGQPLSPTDERRRRPGGRPIIIGPDLTDAIASGRIGGTIGSINVDFLTPHDNPDPAFIGHRHRWAWRTSGSQECFDCGARR
jgi:hypothetical protein